MGEHGNVHLNNILVFHFDENTILVKLCEPGSKLSTFQSQKFYK